MEDTSIPTMPTTIKVAPKDKLEFDRLQAELAVRRGATVNQEQAFAEAVAALRRQLGHGSRILWMPSSREVSEAAWTRIKARMQPSNRKLDLSGSIDRDAYGGEDAPHRRRAAGRSREPGRPAARGRKPSR
jgi:hypothetical protein